MSATLSHDIGYELNHLICGTWFKFPTSLKHRPARVWSGLRTGGWRQTIRFTVKLPADVADCMELIHAVLMVGSDDQIFVNGHVQRQAVLLWAKLRASLGLPVDKTPEEIGPEETAFIRSLKDTPADLTAWLAYADWLRDRGDADSVRRADLIAGWTDPKKALKVRYGVPVLARAKLGLSVPERDE